MPNFNLLVIAGHMTRDPEVKYLANQTAVAEFGIATNRRYTTASGEKKEDVTFVDCSAWGKTGENIAKFFQKGSAILCQGRLSYQSWEDKQTGQKRSKLFMTVESFTFVGGKGDSGNNDSPAPARPLARASGGTRKEHASPPFTEAGIPSDDIPF